MSLDDTEPALLASRLQSRSDAARPFLCEVGKRDRRLLDDSEMLASSDVAKNAVEDFASDSFARPDFLAASDSASVFEVDPIRPVLFTLKNSAHRTVLRFALISRCFLATLRQAP